MRPFQGVSNWIEIINNRFGTDYHIRWYIILVAFLVVPLGIGRTLKFLVPVSAFGIIFIIFGLAVTCYYALIDLPPIKERNYVATPEEIPVFFSTIVFAMEGIGTVLPIEKSMKNPDHFRGIRGVLSISMTLIVTLYSAIGFLGYLKFGEKTEANITLNLPHNWLSEIVKLLVALSILFTYGLQFCVPTEIVWDQIKHKFNSKNDNIAYYVMRGGLILGTVVIALIIPNLGPFIGIVGALCLATLGLFIPSVIEIVTFWEEEANCWRLSKNIFIMLFSLMTTISGCSISIQEVIKTYLH
ncbi:hypothetical protein V9T40_013643 [Parthenolecanium corni]|uniref:Amino acid transporter transmembrane domain-containing protein n=1 Tax=Parthenolecanium corni TaxID=536013 RepID=A0AAN9TDP9_9HEMI